jgi:hypothetical protein
VIPTYEGSTGLSGGHLGLGALLSGVEVRTPLDVVNARVREAYEAKAFVGSRKTVATLVATARTSAEVTTALNRSGLPLRT